MLINRKAVRGYIKELNPNIKQVSADFWPALDSRVCQIVAAAVKNNGGIGRLMARELTEVAPSWIQKIRTAIKI